MSEMPTVAENFERYRRALKTHPLVIVVFKSLDCQLCMGLGPCFKRIAEQYADQVESFIFDTEHIPKVDDVEGTPTLKVFKNGKEVESLLGLGLPGEQQKALLEEVFDEYANTLEPSSGLPAQHQQAGSGLGFSH
ncbi:thiol reductase thioredoxin [Pseudomonas fluorescens]|uniref:Thiol reductase thioredoxin n=1 Tax=Pseudomonas fluorescens TaxID=294 RepID=A0A1T2XZL2_PSEFL|nr:thioredoxin family protein [Pseudomonas fluorescens]OPA85243.1 thiol reductase thioredoxin [Pseudomonas fluorescens]